MATKWFLKSTLRTAFALVTTALVISACEGEPLRVPVGLFLSRQAVEDGSTVFAAHCAICHGPRGDGRGQHRAFMDPAPVNLTLPPWSEPVSAQRTFRAIRYGVPGTAMAGWPMLSDRETWNLVAYIHALSRID